MRANIKVFCILVCGIFFLPQYDLLAQDAPDNQVITADTVDALHLVYVLPACDAMSPDGAYVSGESGVYDAYSGVLVLDKVGTFGPDGLLLIHEVRAFNEMYLEIYDLALGERIITFNGYDVAFSPDQRLIAVNGDGVYALYTWQRLYSIGGFLGARGSVVFSRDGLLLGVGGDGIYDVASGWRYLSVQGAVVFNQDGTLAAVSRGGVFDTLTFEEVFPIDGHNPQFGADDTLLLVSEDGLYDVASGEQLFSVLGYAQFSPDDTLIMVDYNGVYTTDGEKLFAVDGFKGEALPHFHASFSADASLLAVMNDGLYDVAAGERIQTLAEGLPQFSPDGTYLTINGGDGCSVYRADESAEAFGLVRPGRAGVNVRETPDSSLVVTSTTDRLVVFAQNSDGSWYKVQTPAGYGWVSSSAVEVIFMPDDLPEETP